MGFLGCFWALMGLMITNEFQFVSFMDRRDKALLGSKEASFFMNLEGGRRVQVFYKCC